MMGNHESESEQVQALTNLLRTLNPHVPTSDKARELYRRGVRVKTTS